MTAIKRKILELLNKNDCLASKKEIINYLADQNLQPARSTLLRELNFLEKAGIIRKLSFAHNDYYELSSFEHQHLICLHCQRIAPVQLNLLSIKQQVACNDFSLNESKLFLLGFCANCQPRSKR